MHTDWRTYREGEIVTCPLGPTDCAERRGHPRGSDRRTEPRHVEPQRITRVGPGTMILCRVKPRSGTMTLGLTQVQECPRCHTVLELHVCADSGKAA